ncbi:MAG: sulfite exporter TauE/SafE family protein [Patescibacteria group bacterium]
MPNLWAIFLTGITTGGLSCLAVQGGLLANVIGTQAEEELKPNLPEEEVDFSQMSKNNILNYYEHHARVKLPKTFRGDITLTIILFLAAKIAAYTLLGFGLGYLGTMIQLTPFARGILMLAIATFMLGTALRMLNVHPIFNIFQIQPPKFVRKFVSRFSKNKKEDFASPIFLGALTVLIPCGITQAMMALAIGTGSPAAGALILFAFTLGASPVFFLLAYFTTRLGENLNTYFVKIVAVLILIFALVSLESGLNLVGSPVSYNAYKQWRDQPEQLANSQPAATTTTPSATTPTAPPKQPEKPKPPTEQTLTINITDDGYQPNYQTAVADVPTKLKLVSKDAYSCATSFVISSLGIQRILEPNDTQTITLPPRPAGRLRYSCSMGMYTGQIIFQ